jgi:hypothetical protein
VPVADELWDGAGASVSAGAFATDIAEAQGNLMNDNPSLDPRKALVDIQALARVALESADPVVMRHDLEMILTITEGALQPPDPK